VRFDELILAEDEYPQGPCESRAEWLRRYSRGVPVPVIGRWCRVDVKRVRRAVDRQIRLHPLWFDRCLLIHDQPRRATAVERRPTRDQMWWGHYNDLASYMGERGGERPRQNDSPRAAALHSWLVKQGQYFDAGTLSAERAEALEALEALGEWKPQRKENPEEVWNRRLMEFQQFVTTTGRFPVYDRVRRPEERVLAVWLARQRDGKRRGWLQPDRQERLERVSPHWAVPTRGRQIDRKVQESTGVKETPPP
jgi:hypothetical protein